MERKEKLKFVGVIIGAIIFLGIIAYFPCKVLRTETDPNLQLLAIGIILTIVLGGVNMLKSLFKSAEVKTLEKAIESFKNKMKTDRVIEMLKFINSLKSDLEEKIRRMDKSLSGEQFAQSDLLIKPDYKHAHTDILGDENFKWIKEKVDEYNNLVREKRLEEAKEIGNALKDRLEELKRYHVEGLGIAEEKIEKEGKGKVITAVKKKRKEDE